MLGLVELVRLGDRPREAELVDRSTDAAEVLGVVPVDELGADDAGVRAEGLLDHRLHGAGAEFHVVMAEEIERRALDRTERRVRGGSERRVVCTLHERVGEDIGDPLGRVDHRRCVHDEGGEVGVLLRSEGLEHRLEPRTGVARDHHSDHRRDPDAHEGRNGVGRGVGCDVVALHERGGIGAPVVGVLTGAGTGTTGGRARGNSRVLGGAAARWHQDGERHNDRCGERT